MEICKTLLGFAHFHSHGGHESKTTKPDRSFATKTGHFHLLLTSPKLAVAPQPTREQTEQHI